MKEKIKLNTKRLVLRDWNRKDMEYLIENLNNINITKWMHIIPNPYTLEDAKKWMKICEEIEEPRVNYHLAIELKFERHIIGGIALTNVDSLDQTATIGYWLGEKYWNKNYAAEALEEILEFSFNKLNLRRINSSTFVGNVSSRKMLEKYGFKEEGFRKKIYRCKADNELKDEYIFGLLKEDWLDRIKTKNNENE